MYIDDHDENDLMAITYRYDDQQNIKGELSDSVLGKRLQNPSL